MTRHYPQDEQQGYRTFEDIMGVALNHQPPPQEEEKRGMVVEHIKAPIPPEVEEARRQEQMKHQLQSQQAIRHVEETWERMRRLEEKVDMLIKLIQDSGR